MRIVALGVATLIAATLLATTGWSARAQAVNGDRVDRYVFVPVLTRSDVIATPAPAAAITQPVYGLLGELARTAGGRYDFTLNAANGSVYALVGQNPEVEQQIANLASVQPPAPVKIWGLAYPRESNSALPVIVVSGLLRSTPVVVSTPSSPVATIRFDKVNLRAGPSQTYADVGVVVLNQVCAILGRNRPQTWWEIRCAEGVQGWIDVRLVTVQGNTAQIPVMDAPVLAGDIPSAAPSSTPTSTPPAFRFWKASLFPNQNLSGAPVAMADVQSINFDWGSGSPSALLPGDGFSLRFERTINFAPGYYQFELLADDGVRLWLDNSLLINEWHGASANMYTVSRTLSGQHDLRLEYFEASGLASLRFTYEIFSQSPAWNVTYYRGTGLEGQPLLVQQEPRSQLPLDQNWAFGSPAPDVLGEDFWSARWVGQFWFASGDYLFHARVDDGVRVYVDGLRVLDYWYDGYKEIANRFTAIGQGPHTIKVEYYERSGAASVRVWWEWEPSESGPR